MVEQALNSLAQAGFGDLVAQARIILNTPDPAEGPVPPGWMAESRIIAAVSLLAPPQPDPLIGIRAGRELQFATFGVLGFIAQNCRTLGEAITFVLRFESLICNTSRFRLEHQPGLTLLQWTPHGLPDERLQRYFGEYLLSGLVHLMRQLLLPPHDPVLAVHFPYAAPTDGALRASYQQWLGCPVYFQQAQSAIVLATADLDLPLRYSNPELRETLERHALQQLVQLDAQQQLADQVRTLLRSLLRHGGASRERVAAQLGITGRTLHRRLEQEGQSYQTLLDELRLELAQSHLLQTTATVEEVSQRLGFTETQSFIRWFRRQLGLAPGAYRRQHQA